MPILAPVTNTPRLPLQDAPTLINGVPTIEDFRKAVRLELECEKAISLNLNTTQADFEDLKTARSHLVQVEATMAMANQANNNANAVIFAAAPLWAQALNNNFTTLSTKVDTLSTKVDTLSTKVDTLSTKVDTIERTMTAGFRQIEAKAFNGLAASHDNHDAFLPVPNLENIDAPAGFAPIQSKADLQALRRPEVEAWLAHYNVQHAPAESKAELAERLLRFVAR